MKELIITTLGWVGSAFIIIAYALTLYKNDDFTLTLCKYLNLVGGLLIAFNCFQNNAIPPFATNLLWSGIAIFSILKLGFRSFLKVQKTFRLKVTVLVSS